MAEVYPEEAVDDGVFKRGKVRAEVEWYDTSET